LSQHLFGGWQCVVGPAIRRLHDDDVCGGWFAKLSGAAGAELEIAGIEEASILGVIDCDHGRAVDVAGRVEGDGDLRVVVGEWGRLVKGEFTLEAFAVGVGHAGSHEGGGAGREQNLAVRGEVVEVGVRDEAARDGVVSVEPPVELREVEAVAIVDVPRHEPT
jgi:hypothetical protein